MNMINAFAQTQFILHNIQIQFNEIPRMQVSELFIIQYPFN